MKNIHLWKIFLWLVPCKLLWYSPPIFWYKKLKNIWCDNVQIKISIYHRPFIIWWSWNTTRTMKNWLVCCNERVFWAFQRSLWSCLGTRGLYLSRWNTISNAYTSQFQAVHSDKPAKHDMLFKLLNSPRYSYTYQSHIYCGKLEDPESSIQYVQDTINYINFLVNKLIITP